MTEPKDPTTADATPAPDLTADEQEKEKILRNLEAVVGEEALLRFEWMSVALKKLKQDLLHDAETFSDWLAANEPAAKREWQRHLAALTIANGIMCGGSGTLTERLDMARSNRDMLIEFAYAMAETAMQHRERLAKVEAAEGQGKQPAPNVNPPGTFKLVHILKHGFALCRTIDGIPREWPAGHKWVDSEGWELSNCVGCLVAHGRRLVDDHKEVKGGA